LMHVKGISVLVSWSTKLNNPTKSPYVSLFQLFLASIS
jgi:hypothetical protein